MPKKYVVVEEENKSDGCGGCAAGIGVLAAVLFFGAGIISAIFESCTGP